MSLLLVLGCLTVLGGLLALALVEKLRNQDKIDQAVNPNNTHDPLQNGDQSCAEECR